MNNSVYWSVSRTTWRPTPNCWPAPLRVTIEHEAPVALGDKMESSRMFTRPDRPINSVAALTDRPVTTLTYAVGDETKAVAAMFAL